MPESPLVAIVTGATGNVGSATVAVLAQQGAHVVAVDRRPERLRSLLDPLAGADRHLPVAEMDLTDPAACDNVVAQAMRRFGRIDALVNTVGGFAMADLAQSGPDLWEQMFSANVATTLNIFRAAIVQMRPARRGSLVAIGAGAALRAPAGMSAYAASKSAVLRLSESFADELKAEGIRVNAVLPGIIDTPQNRAAMPAADHAAWVRPAEVAEAIAFLLSDAASGITGALLAVNGRG